MSSLLWLVEPRFFAWCPRHVQQFTGDFVPIGVAVGAFRDVDPVRFVFEFYCLFVCDVHVKECDDFL